MPQDPWAEFRVGAPPAPPRQAPGIIHGPPKISDPVSVQNANRGDRTEDRQTAEGTWATMTPEEVKAAGLAPGKIYQRNGMGEINEVGAGAQSSQADAAAKDKLMRLITQMGNISLDANDNGGLGETGWLGSQLRGWSGTAAFDLGKDIDTLDASFAFDALQAMRDASKTGGALGSITERELDLLKSTVANLDPNQSQENFLAKMRSARQMYLSKLAMLDPDAAGELGYNQAEAQAAYKAAADAYEQAFPTQGFQIKFNEPKTSSGWGKAKVVG